MHILEPPLGARLDRLQNSALCVVRIRQDHAVLGCTWTVILHRKLFDLLQKLLSRVVEVGTDSQRELFFRFEAGLIAHVLTVS